MATRAIVGMKLGSICYLSVYTHSDGYPSHHLPILVEHYNTADKVKELLSNGAISILAERCDGAAGIHDIYGKELDSYTKHTFNTPVKSQTVYYGRDRLDVTKGVSEPEKHTTLGRFNDEDYGYLFKDSAWHVVKGRTLIPHTEFLKDGVYQDDRQD
jgi:hypothetical protein